MKEESIFHQKSFSFALRILRLSKYLRSQKEFILADQILRSGTSIGANLEEGSGSHTRKEFALRVSTAYKEARETKYWLRLLKEGSILSDKQINPLLIKCEELIKLLGSAQLTLSGRKKNQPRST